MWLEPGVTRELHWECLCAQIGFSSSRGASAVTVVDPAGGAEINDFDLADVWYFRAVMHTRLACLDEPCHFILIFDNGYFSKLRHLQHYRLAGSRSPRTFWCKGLRAAGLATFEFPQRAHFVHGRVPRWTPCPEGALTRRLPHKYQLLAQEPASRSTKFGREPAGRRVPLSDIRDHDGSGSGSIPAACNCDSALAP